MHPTLFHLPYIDYPVRSYGAMLTIGFLTGVWIAMRRAERVKADPDVVLNLGFICLICGVVGARVFYVVHYWGSAFAPQPHPVAAALNCTAGGMEYYGGLICAMIGVAVYVVIKRVSVRMYVDILAPVAAWGLAFGRMGCFLNGCCWGGVCVTPEGHAVVPWGVRFPHSSFAQTRQWENRQLTLPAELIVTSPSYPEPIPLPKSELDMPVEKREGPAMRLRHAEEEIRSLKALNAEPQEIERLKNEKEKAEKEAKEMQGRLFALSEAQRFPARTDPSRGMTVSELEDLANKYPSLPVQPTQIYGVINALLLSWVLTELFYRRKRHGVVFAALCIIYPITRVVLEIIRVDNPHDTAHLTVSQGVSVVMFLFGLALLWALYRMPLRSPLAVPYVPPEEDETK
jgi:phosphatidylglycerol:prolipoprotein diacylglycerol transferase